MDARNMAKEERIPCRPNLRNAMPLNGFRPLATPGAPGLNPRHEPVQLARKIDGARFEASFAIPSDRKPMLHMMRSLAAELRAMR